MQSTLCARLTFQDSVEKDGSRKKVWRMYDVVHNQLTNPQGEGLL